MKSFTDDNLEKSSCPKNHKPKTLLKMPIREIVANNASKAHSICTTFFQEANKS